MEKKSSKDEMRSRGWLLDQLNSSQANSTPSLVCPQPWVINSKHDTSKFEKLDNDKSTNKDLYLFTSGFDKH